MRWCSNLFSRNHILFVSMSFFCCRLVTNKSKLFKPVALLRASERPFPSIISPTKLNSSFRPQKTVLLRTGELSNNRAGQKPGYFRVHSSHAIRLNYSMNMYIIRWGWMKIEMVKLVFHCQITTALKYHGYTNRRSTSKIEAHRLRHNRQRLNLIA